MSIQSNFPAIKPSLLLDFANTKQLDPRVTFARATTATYYDGVTTAKAEENLLLQSQTFSNASWTKTNSTITANAATAPDGTTTASTFASSGTLPLRCDIIQSNAASSVGKTASIYAKAGTGNFIQIFFAGDAAPWANFDLSTGAVGSTGTTVTASIVNVGSGWYRCIVTTTSTTASDFSVMLAASSTAGRASTISSAADVLLWGAQVEQRSSVTAYTATTTQAITNYIPVLMTAASGVPRFDHNPTTDESLGLLIEEQRTNLFTYSSDYTNAAWIKTNTTITADTIVAPDGTLTGDKVVENTAAGFHYVRQNISVSAIAYTMSFFAKAAERSFVWATLDGGNNQGWFNLSAGTTGVNGVGSTQITSVGNGWYRCSYTATLSAGTAPCFIFLATSTSTASYTGDGYSGAYIWGAQLEAGAFATSYIPTVASTVTRNADAASMTGTNFSSWYSAGEGSFYSSVLARGYTLNQMLFSATDGTLNNPLQTYFDSASQIQTNVWGNGTVLRAATIGTQVEYALGMALNNVSATIGGGNVTTDTSVGPAYPYTQLNIGNRNGTLVFNGTIKKIAYYPLRVTNAQLQALTS